MRWLLLAALAGLVLSGPANAFASDDYGWQLPASPTDVCVHISASDTNPSWWNSAPWVGDRSLYLWTTQCISASTGSEFGLIGSLQIVDLIPRNGVVSVPGVGGFTLQYPECFGEEVVAEIVVRDPTGLGGTLCWGPHQLTGRNDSQKGCTEDYFPHAYSGFSSDGTMPCHGPVPIRPLSWGKLRAPYR